MSGIRAPNLPTTGLIDKLLGTQTTDGVSSTRQIAVDDLANQMLGDGPLSDVVNAALDVGGGYYVIAQAQTSGTVNAIEATTADPIAADSLVLLRILGANTASPVTVKFNSGSVLTVKTAGGSDIPVGAMITAIGMVIGSTFRLRQDLAGSVVAEAAAESAIQAQGFRDEAGLSAIAAEAARDLANSYAGIDFRANTAAGLVGLGANGDTALIVGGADDGFYTKISGTWTRQSPSGIAGSGLGINLIENGNLDNNGDGVQRYFDLGNPSWNSTFQTISQTDLARFGCNHAIACIGPVTSGNSYGQLVSVPVRLSGGRIYASVLIYDPTGNFNFGTNQGIGLFARYTDGTNSFAGLLSFGSPTGEFAHEVISSTVRRYYTTLAFTVGKVCSRIDWGINDANNSRPATLYETGFWISWTSQASISLNQTLYPEWQASAQRTYKALQVSVKTNTTDVATINAQLYASGLSVSDGLWDLSKAIHDMTRSLDVVLLGDSNTWGVINDDGASSSQTPRTGALTDVRQNTNVPTWANLFRKWLGYRVCSGFNKEDPAPGEARYYEDVIVDPIRNPEFGVYVTSTGVKTTPFSVTDPYTGGGSGGTNPTLMKYVDIALGTELRFDFVGDRFTIYHASIQTAGPTQTYQVYVDGVLNNTFGLYADPPLFNQSDTVSGLAFGKHSVRLVPTVSYLRLEAIGFRRRCIVRNNGIIGTNTTQWKPGGSISLTDAVASTATHVVIMLGTNDRQNTTLPREPSKSADNIELIVNWLATNRPNAKVIICTTLLCRGNLEFGSSTPANDYRFHSGRLAEAIKRMASRRSLAVVDVYAKTVEEMLSGGNWLGTDDIHFSTYGHASIFKLWTSMLTSRN